MTYKDLIVTKNSTVKNCFEKIIKTGIKCLVVQEKKKLIGTVSDGDLRRGLLKGIKLNEHIKSLYNKNPFYIDKNISKEKIDYLISKKRYEIIPHINNDKKILDIYSWKNSGKKKKLFKSLKNKVEVIVMAGGRGTRLLPYTSIVPKPLLLLKNKPIIDLIIENFSNHKINKFHLSINYQASFMKSYFQLNHKKLNIKFITESKPLGTVGSLSKIKASDKKQFIVSNCDIIVDVDFYDLYKFHNENKNDLTIVSAFKTFELSYGNIIIDKNGDFFEMIEKPKKNFLFNTGVYILNSSTLKEIPKNKNYNFDLFINKLKNKNFKLGVYPISEKLWKDIGHSPDYDKN